MTSTSPHRPDTIMGRALAERALRVVEQQTLGGRADRNAIIDLTVPEDIHLPAHVREAAKEALDRGATHYTVRPGITELREAIAHCQTEDGFPATVDGTVITNGGSEALYIALQCVVTPGDSVLIVGPVAPNVIQMIEFIGGTSIHVTGDEESGFFPAIEQIRKFQASVVLLTSPSPISGTSLPKDQIEELLSIARERELEVILDRSATNCLYESASLAPVSPELGDYPITIGSFSTSYGLSGWRVGYFTAPERLMAKLRNLKQAMSICTTAVSQYAALSALNGPAEWLEERRTSFKQRLTEVTERLKAAGIPYVPPDAFPALLIDIRAVNNDDVLTARQLEDTGVRVDPGSVYGSGTRGFVRVDLGVPEANLLSGVDRIVDLYSDRSSS